MKAILQPRCGGWMNPLVMSLDSIYSAPQKRTIAQRDEAVKRGRGNFASEE